MGKPYEAMRVNYVGQVRNVIQMSFGGGGGSAARKTGRNNDPSGQHSLKPGQGAPRG
jgi:hypothetical protein